MVHVCTPELDRGATVAFDEFAIDDLRGRHSSKEELASALRERQRSREVLLLMETIMMLSRDDLRIRKGAMIGNDLDPSGSLDLSLTIDQMMKHRGD